MDTLSAAPCLWKWTWQDLIRMEEAGLLPAEGRFELLDGEIYQLMPPGPLHAFVVDLIGGILEQLAQGYRSHAREEKPIALNDAYHPQPDVAVAQGAPATYRTRFPRPEEVLLVVEVADSSLEHDRTLKLPAYAAAGIPECWLVNLIDRQVEVYREPAEGVYRLRRLYRAGEAANPLFAPDVSITISDLLGEGEPTAIL
ncbi:MAG: Uma2 family endonuclease [Actinomycetota bacterium]